MAGVSLMMGALGGAARAGEDLADKRIDQLNRSEYAAERDAANIRFQQMANDFANQREKTRRGWQVDDRNNERQYQQELGESNFQKSVDPARIALINQANNLRTMGDVAEAAKLDQMLANTGQTIANTAGTDARTTLMSRPRTETVSTGGEGGTGKQKPASSKEIDSMAQIVSGMKSALTPMQQESAQNTYWQIKVRADEIARDNPEFSAVQVVDRAKREVDAAQNNTTGVKKEDDRSLFQKTKDFFTGGDASASDNNDGVVQSRNQVFDDVGAARNKAPDGDIGKLEIGTVIKRGDGKLPVRLMPNGKWEDIIPGMDRRQDKQESVSTPKPANTGNGRTYSTIQVSPGIPKPAPRVSLMAPGLIEQTKKQIQDNANRAVTPEPSLAPVSASPSEINQESVTDIRAAKDAGNAEIEKMIAERRAEKTPAKPAAQTAQEQIKSEWEEVTRLNERKIVDEFGQGIPFEEKAANEQRMRELVQQIAKRSGTNWRDIAKRVDSDYASLREQAKGAFERDGERAVGISGANQSVTEDALLPPAEGMKQRAEETKKESGGMDFAQLEKVLTANADKNFVQRILHPESSPQLDMGNGQHATHLMSYGEADGKYIVFPTVQMDNGKLKNYGDQAFDRAMKSGEYISFDNEKDAEWFSKNYKQYWEKNEKEPGTPAKTVTEPAKQEPRAMPEQLPPEQDMKGIRDELYGRMSLLHGKIVEDKTGKQSKELAAEREALIQEIAEKTNMPVDEVRKNADENLDLQKAFWADDDTEKTRSSKLIVDSAESTLDKIEKLIEQGSSPDDFIPEIESAQKNIREHGAEPKPRKLIPSKFK